ncbi:NAD(P)H-dependent oxidoreductase [Streptococcus tangpeifui]|uniref:NAD(P)H-dependent oxidoreductase n=1 Tax=Streptococcus tangpeifui TaxID=2709400 RepID=UPI0013E9C47D|nr:MULTISPECIES: NAD(P)H-dependent oxidoreductase [unclassified Streptococcus]
MTTRIFLFHPNPDQSRANKAMAQAAAEQGIEVRNLYALYPDGKIDVKKEQAALTATDRIVLQFPMYWYSMPSLMKEWLDQILEYGWAYGSSGDALQGKQVLLAVTQGAGAQDYTANGRFHVTTQELLKPIETIKYHTGLVFEEPFVLSGVLNLSNEKLAQEAANYVGCLQES